MGGPSRRLLPKDRHVAVVGGLVCLLSIRFIWKLLRISVLTLGLTFGMLRNAPALRHIPKNSCEGDYTLGGPTNKLTHTSYRLFTGSRGDEIRNGRT